MVTKLDDCTNWPTYHLPRTSLNIVSMMPQVAKSQFTFVNISNATTQNEAIRGTVSRHLQGIRRRKKQQDARRLLQSSRFVRQNLAEGTTCTQALHDAEINDSTLQTRSPQVLPPLMSVLLLNADLKHMDAAPDIPSATFDFLVGFERDLVQPALARMEYQVTHTASKYNSLWSEATKAYLYDNLAVYSFLARIAATMHMVTGHEQHRTAAYQYRDKAIISLRRYLNDTTELDIKRLYRAIVILILAESAMGDRDALRVHTNMLHDLVLSHSRMITDNPLYGVDEVNTIVYQDVQIAVMNLTSTFFDLRRKGWIEQLFHPLWQDQSKILTEKFSDADTRLAPELQGELRRLYAEVRANMDMIVEMRQNYSVASMHTTWLKYFTRAVFVLGRLMNHYAHCLSKVDSLISESWQIDSPRLQGILCLCAVFWLREFLGVENVLLSDKLRIFTANKTIFLKLREYIESTDFTGDGSTSSTHNSKLKLYIWILFSGTSLERSLTKSDVIITTQEQSGGGQGLLTFAGLLTRILRVMDKTVEDYRVTLQSFLPQEYLRELIQPEVQAL
jgi:hypothetical protein